MPIEAITLPTSSQFRFLCDGCRNFWPSAGKTRAEAIESAKSDGWTIATAGGVGSELVVCPNCTKRIDDYASRVNGAADRATKPNWTGEKT